MKKKETFVEAMKRSPEEKLAWLIVGNETEEVLKDIKKAIKEANKELLYIYGLRRFFCDYARENKKGEG
jgi:hypothetical protein